MEHRKLSRIRKEANWRLLRLSALTIGVLLIANMTADAQRLVRTEMLGGSGGKLSEYVCGPGRILVGVQGYAGVWLDNVQAICAKVEANGLTDTRAEGPIFGGNRPLNGSAKCPGDSFVKLAQVTETENSPYVGRIAFTCDGERIEAELRGTGHLKGYISPVLTAPRSETLIGGYIECPEAAVVVGISVRTGDFLNAFGLICGPKPRTLSKHKKPTSPKVAKDRSKDSPDRTTVPGIDKPTTVDVHAQPEPTPTASGIGSQPPSTDIDKPAPFPATELKAELRQGAPANFYTLTVGPGEVVFTLKATGGKPGGGAIYFYLLNPESKNIESDFWLFGPNGGSDQVIKKIEYAERRTIILKKGEEIGTGSYHLSISGAVSQN